MPAPADPALSLFVRTLPQLFRCLNPGRLHYDEQRQARRVKPSASPGAPQEAFPPGHRHPHLELCVLLSGRCPFLLGERRIMLSRGHVAALGPEAFHRELDAERCGPYRLLWLSSFRARAVVFLQRHLGQRRFARDELRVSLDPFPAAWQTLQAVDHELWAAQPGHFLRVQGLLLQLCGHLEQARARQLSDRRRDPEEAVQKQRVERAIQYIHEHFSEPVDLGEAAVHCGVSPAYLSALFSRVLGRSFTDFLTACRMEEAQRLLADPTLSIKEVAQRTGIPDPLYFSRLFHRRTGVPPSGFRRRLNTRHPR